MRNTKLVMVLFAALASASCKGKGDSKLDRAERQEIGGNQPTAVVPMTDTVASPPPALEEERSKKEGKLDDNEAGGGLKGVMADGDEDGVGDDRAASGPGKNRKANRPEGITRAWFPETFLFEPLVITDDTGTATVATRVPDRLTTWRVLALAHSRSGAQGGAVTSFLGTLPTYVDPVVPKTLVIGDQVRVPIQVVNTTTAAVSTSLAVEAENATVTGAPATITIPAQATRVVYARLRVEHAGKVALRVTLGDTDAVLRTIAVVPAGRPMTTTRSGTLAAPRTLTIQGVAGADPSTDHVRLLAFPGALALLRSELGVSVSRSSVADDAYALLLAGRATAMLSALGDKADPEVVRDLSIVTGQRAIRHARSLDVTTATLLTEAALAHPDNPVLQRLGTRAAEFLASHQLPDGTFAGGDGWTLQRVLVATADATRAVGSATATPADRQRATAVAVRASGAFERNIIHVEDGFTAAAILATGAVDGTIADGLRGLVRDAIKATDDGAKYLEVGDGVVRADGEIPSRVEATALAVLALAGDATAPVADLGATLLGSYSMERGWGDGRTNLVAMRAVLDLFKDPVPADVTIKLLMDGVPVVEGVLARDKLREVLVLDAPAPGLAGAHRWEVVAEPPVPGLGYSLSLESWVPWTKETTQGGLELQLSPTMTGAVGKPIPIALTAIAPSGLPLHIQHALPTGVQVDTPSLQALVDDGTLARFTVADGTLDLHADALDPGEVFTAKYRVIPTLAGTLHTTASTIEAGTTTFHVPPTVWNIE
jgi:hypothetical protein